MTRGRARRLASAALLAAAAAALPAFAQPADGRIPTVTRLVKLFSGLEADLVAKAHASDASALDAMLDAAFELRAGDVPGTPIPRDAWMQAARAAPNVPPDITQMAVHDLGGVALVSFRDATTKPPRFVVDAWKRDGDTWKLAVRYQADAGTKSAARPKSPRTIDKRY
jgi:hypothetical protein